jgi:hypothetical protein
MFKVNCKQLVFFGFIFLFLLTSCSKELQNSGSLELTIDGGKIFQEKVMPNEKISEKHDVNKLIIESCMLSNFVGASQTNAMTMNKTITKTKNLPASRSIINTSILKIGFIPTDANGSIFCFANTEKENSPGCIRSNSDKSQYQYTLELRNLLQSNYGMKRDAIWIYHRYNAVGQISRDQVQLVKITNEYLSCTKRIETKKI